MIGWKSNGQIYPIPWLQSRAYGNSASSMPYPLEGPNNYCWPSASGISASTPNQVDLLTLECANSFLLPATNGRHILKSPEAKWVMTLQGQVVWLATSMTPRSTIKHYYISERTGWSLLESLPLNPGSPWMWKGCVQQSNSEWHISTHIEGQVETLTQAFLCYQAIVVSNGLFMTMLGWLLGP